MKILPLALAALVAIATSCTAQARTRLTPSANITHQTVRITNIDGIEASRVKVIYTPGTFAGNVAVAAPDNVMPYVRVNVSNGTLECSIDDDVEVRGLNGPCVTITVTAPDVHEFDASLSAVIDIRGNLSLKEFSAETSTSGSITGRNVQCRESVELEVGTAGTVTLSAVSAPEISLETSTSGTITLGSVTTAKLDAESTTSGTITLRGGTAEKVDYSASTSGTIHASAVTATKGSLDASTSGTLHCKVLRPTRTEQSTGGTIRNDTD